MQLSELARWTIRPRLMAVPGVANVAIWGLRDRQLQVLVDPDRLRAAGVTLAELRRPAMRGAGRRGGFVDTATSGLAVQQTGTVQTAAELAQAVVKQAAKRRSASATSPAWSTASPRRSATRSSTTARASC
jgi:Cu/Ag efflux pump CusA